jgi:membrane fusion protein (multidrug efflux system)
MNLRGARGAFAAMVGLTLLLGGCSAEAPPSAPPPPEVRIVTVRPQSVANVIELPGRVQAVRTADVRARVDGIVQRRLYEEGSDVGAGRPLFAIDPRELRADLNAVQASLARARATAANAAQDVARYRPLLAEQAVSRQEYDSAVARMRTAQADVAQANAQLARARLSLGYTTVTAPISGRAGRAEVTEGALVSASAGTLLTRIEQLDPIHVNFAQSSADLLALRRGAAAGGTSVELVLEDGSVYGAAGRLDFLDLAIDQTTGTAALRAVFPNPGRILLPGQFVRARLRVGSRPDGIVVPQRAVKVGPSGASVMVVGAGEIVAVRPVRLGEMQGASWVVTSGLKSGDRVIVDGLQKVQPGQPVRIAGAPPAAPAQKPAKR